MSVSQCIQASLRRMRGLFVVVVLCLIVPLEAAEQPAKEMSASDRQAKLKERDRIGSESRKLQQGGELNQAIAAAEKMLEIEQQLFGDRCDDVVGSLQWLAKLHEQRQDFTVPAKRLREVHDIQTARYPKDDWRVTDARLALADLTARAKLDGEQRKRLTEADQLNGQVETLGNRANYRHALPLAERALEIRKELLGDEHPDTLASLNNLGWVCRELRQLDRANQLYLQARVLRKKVLGEQHPAYALTLNSLGWLHEYQGEHAKAKLLFQQAAAIYQATEGEKSAGYAISLDNLAALYRSTGVYAKAEPLYCQALKITRECLQLTTTVQSERQQLRMADSQRPQLDSYLSVIVQAQAKANLPSGSTLRELYGLFLDWKGAVFMQQSRQRLTRSQPELKALFAEWQRVSSRLATRALAVPTPAQHSVWHRDLVQLTEEKERLEAELAHKSITFRRQQQERKCTLEDVQKTLSADTALLDFLEYNYYNPGLKTKGKWDPERRLIAFVIRRGHKLETVELGAVRPLAEAIDKWRASFGSYGQRHNVEAAQLLRDKLWLPLERHVKGVKTVLVWPDGVLAKMPFAALPGDKPDSYLLKTWNFAIVPVPQLLPSMLAPLEKADATSPSLLLIGDVDYGAMPGLADMLTSRSAPAAGRGWNTNSWRPLPATRDRLAVKHSYPSSDRIGS